jgi:hypothetical protein
MKTVEILRGTVVALASIGMLLPQLALGVETARPNPNALSTAVRDVALQEDGVLKGQVLDKQGAPLAGIPVVVARQGKQIAKTETAADGSFAVSGLNGGVYEIITARGNAVYRLWAPRTAPPAATAQALIVSGDTVVRGAMGGSLVWILGGIVAAAIAIPLAMDDDDDAS